VGAPTALSANPIAARYERRSSMITANQPFGEWGGIFPRLGYDPPWV